MKNKILILSIIFVLIFLSGCLNSDIPIAVGINSNGSNSSGTIDTIQSNTNGGKLLVIQNSSAVDINLLTLTWDGNVGIKKNSPKSSLDVKGDINGDRLCINGDCRAVWPTSGSFTDTTLDSNQPALNHFLIGSYKWGGISDFNNDTNFSDLNVYGSLCIHDDCRTAWPSSGTFTDTTLDSNAPALNNFLRRDMNYSGNIDFNNNAGLKVRGLNVDNNTGFIDSNSDGLTFRDINNPNGATLTRLLQSSASSSFTDTTVDSNSAARNHFLTLDLNWSGRNDFNIQLCIKGVCKGAWDLNNITDTTLDTNAPALNSFLFRDLNWSGQYDFNAPEANGKAFRVKQDVNFGADLNVNGNLFVLGSGGGTPLMAFISSLAIGTISFTNQFFVNDDWLPGSNNSFNLGSSTSKWNNVNTNNIISTGAMTLNVNSGSDLNITVTNGGAGKENFVNNDGNNYFSNPGNLYMTGMYFPDKNIATARDENKGWIINGMINIGTTTIGTSGTTYAASVSAIIGVPLTCLHAIGGNGVDNGCADISVVDTIWAKVG